MAKNHEKEHGHLVAKRLDPVFKAPGNQSDEQNWYCEGCEHGTRVVRTWDGTNWSPWRDA